MFDPCCKIKLKFIPQNAGDCVQMRAAHVTLRAPGGFWELRFLDLTSSHHLFFLLRRNELISLFEPGSTCQLHPRHGGDLRAAHLDNLNNVSPLWYSGYTSQSHVFFIVFVSTLCGYQAMLEQHVDIMLEDSLWIQQNSCH